MTGFKFLCGEPREIAHFGVLFCRVCVQLLGIMMGLFRHMLFVKRIWNIVGMFDVLSSNLLVVP